MLVELDIFSGRPNPTAVVSHDEAAAITALVSKLPIVQRPAPEPPALGYRGFAITDPDTGWRVRVHHTTVTEGVGSDVVVRYDPQASLERMLSEIAGANVDAPTRDFMERLIGSGDPSSGLSE